MLQLKKMDVKLEKALGTDIPKNAKMIQEAFDAITGTEAELDEVRASVSNCVKIQDLEPTLLNVVDPKFPEKSSRASRRSSPTSTMMCLTPAPPMTGRWRR